MKKLSWAFGAGVMTILAAVPAWAVEFEGGIADQITLFLYGVIALLFGGLAYAWLRWGAKKGLDKVGLGSLFPVVDPYIKNLVLAVEEKARQMAKDSGVAMSGEDKLEWVLTRVDAILEKFGLDLDAPEVIDWIEAKVAELRLAGLDYLKEETDKFLPPQE